MKYELSTYRTACEWKTLGVFLLGINQTQINSDLSFRISNDRVGEFIPAAVGVDIFDPVFVGLHVITGQSDHLHATITELLVQLGHTTQFCCADWSEIGWMREQDGPTAWRKKYFLRSAQMLFQGWIN